MSDKDTSKNGDTKTKKALSGLFKRTESVSPPAILTKQAVSTPDNPSTTTPQLKGESEKEESNSGLQSIQKLFSENTSQRETWNISRYKELILRVDRSQTEAFFLKGKLLEEVKTKFFSDLEREQNWKDFCVNELNINYTTANQYIRVAQEFDVTSHQREDFSFEHFKILLPLPHATREQIIKSSPKLSVKSFRLLVQEKVKLTQPPARSGATSHKSRLKEFLRLLETTKNALQVWDASELSQAERWQVSGACLNLCEELKNLSEDMLGSQTNAKRTTTTKKDEVIVINQEE